MNQVRDPSNRCQLTVNLFICVWTTCGDWTTSGSNMYIYLHHTKYYNKSTICSGFFFTWKNSAKRMTLSPIRQIQGLTQEQIWGLTILSPISVTRIPILSPISVTRMKNESVNIREWYSYQQRSGRNGFSSGFPSGCALGKSLGKPIPSLPLLVRV